MQLRLPMQTHGSGIPVFICTRCLYWRRDFLCPDMPSVKTILEKDDIARALTRIAHEILEKNRSAEDLVIVGIKTRGGPLAERLAEKIASIEGGKKLPLGSLDITFYRDDAATSAPRAAEESSIDFDITGKTVVLVDDVLYTGRTVRAAMSGLMDYGRPEKVQLAVLIDRGLRELPIRADYVGKNLPTSTKEKVRVLLADTDGNDRVEIER